MSSEKLEKAISEYVTETCEGQISTSWVLITASTDGDDGDIAISWSDGQPKYISLGLIEASKIIIKSEAYFGGDSE